MAASCSASFAFSTSGVQISCRCVLISFFCVNTQFCKIIKNDYSTSVHNFFHHFVYPKKTGRILHDSFRDVLFVSCIIHQNVQLAYSFPSSTIFLLLQMLRRNIKVSNDAGFRIYFYVSTFFGKDNVTGEIFKIHTYSLIFLLIIISSGKKVETQKL